MHLAAVAQTTTAGGDWPSYGGDLKSGKYSPLDQITRDNFDDLVVAWRWKSVDTRLSKTVAGGEWWSSSDEIFAQLQKENPTRWRGGLVPQDKATGAVVGTVAVPSRVLGTPMTYEHDGKQYIAFTVTGNPPELIALSLP